MLGAYIGKKLDERFQMEKPLFTILFVLIAIIAALYLALKDLIRHK